MVELHGPWSMVHRPRAQRAIEAAVVESSERIFRTEDGAYRAYELIAAGAFGSVYYGRRLADHTPVAIKVLQTHHARNWQVVARFEQEAPLVRQLDHPNIVRVLDQGRDDDGLPFIVMEWVTGWTLGHLIQEYGACPPESAVKMICQVLDGLEHARLRGIVHRDIKPANLMLTTEHLVKVMDFGVAKTAELAAASGTSIVGTPAFMAPEQFVGEPPDVRTDIYAVGITLYQLLTGRLPFEADTAGGYMYQHLQKEPPSLTSIRPDIDPALAAVLECALAKSPDQRFPTPGAMHAALLPFTSSNVQILRPPAAPPRTPARVPWIKALLAATIVAALVGGSLLLREGSPSWPLSPAADAPPTLSEAADSLPTASVVADIPPAVPAPPTLQPPPTVQPPPTAQPPPTNPPTAQPPPPTPVAAEPKVLVVELTSPSNGARVGEVAVVRGRLRGPWDPARQHLWLLAGPRQGSTNLWVHPEEIVPQPNGEWESRPYIGGEPGRFHRLIVGVVDEAGHALIERHIATRSGQPFADGPPLGFTPVVEISVEKAR